MVALVHDGRFYSDDDVRPEEKCTSFAFPSTSEEVPETSKSVLPHEFQPSPEKRTRFALLSTPEELLQASKGVLAKDTLKNDQWAYCVFDEWVKERITICEEDRCPDYLLKTSDAKLLGKWLSYLAMEVCKKDGSKYPPSTIHLILCGLQRIMHRSSDAPFNIFNKKDIQFHGFRGTMETVFQQLHSEGVGVKRNHAEVISKEEEELLWEGQIIGCHLPRALIRATFFLNGKNFCLQGGKEQRQMKYVQLTREDDHWTYTEHGSKNYRGRFGNLNHENKVVQQLPWPGDDDRYHVKLLDLYVSKLPYEAKQKDAFYFTPLQSIPADPQKP